MVRTHQPGQAVFTSVLPDDIDWKPFPAFPPSVRLAVLVGQPSEPGPYVIRVKVPSGVIGSHLPRTSDERCTERAPRGALLGCSPRAKGLTVRHMRCGTPFVF